MNTLQLTLFNTQEYFIPIASYAKAQIYKSIGYNALYSTKTKVIRVPCNLADYLKELAKKIDSKEITKEDIEKPVTVAKPITTLGLVELDPSAIEVDARRFQFKIIHNGNSGSTGSLNGCKTWNYDLAGLILVWLDPIDGKTYVVNGHNRLDLAKKLEINRIACRYIQAKDYKEARLIGAMANIAEGKGSPIDAAKIFRDSKLTIDDLRAYGLNIKDKLAKDGHNIANLVDFLWTKTLTGELDEKTASAIGQCEIQNDQINLYKLISKEKRNLTTDVLNELVATVKASEGSQASLFSLLGNYQESTAIERSQLIAYIQSRLKTEKRLFSTVSKSKNSSILERGNNSIDTLTSSQIADQSDRALNTFNTLKNVSSPISVVINDYSLKMKSSKNVKALQDACYSDVFKILASESLLDLMTA